MSKLSLYQRDDDGIPPVIKEDLSDNYPIPNHLTLWDEFYGKIDLYTVDTIGIDLVFKTGTIKYRYGKAWFEPTKDDTL